MSRIGEAGEVQPDFCTQDMQDMPTHPRNRFQAQERVLDRLQTTFNLLQGAAQSIDPAGPGG